MTEYPFEIEAVNTKTGETITYTPEPRRVCFNTLPLAEKRKRSYPRVGICIALVEDAGNWALDHPGTPIAFILFLGVILGLLVGSQII